MTIPKPNKNEKYKKYMSRCLKNPAMKKEFKNIKQRFAVCASNWRKK